MRNQVRACRTARCPGFSCRAALRCAALQVDVTDQSATATTPIGVTAANAVGQALQNMNWVGVDPWASFPTGGPSTAHFSKLLNWR